MTTKIHLRSIALFFSGIVLFVLDERVVRPLQERLSLPGSAFGIPPSAVFLHLCHMSSKRFPSSNLFFIGEILSSSDVKTAVPLEPSSDILAENPVLPLPFGQGLSRFYTETIDRRVRAERIGSYTCTRKPFFRKFVHTIIQVFSLKDTES